MHYDFLLRPTGFRTDLILIISPYFDLKFVKQALESLKPKKVRILVDDGANRNDLEQMREVCEAFDTKIALGKSQGIVHLKGFYIEFVRTKGRKQRQRRFLFGSANATDAAFGGGRNAELFATVNLSASDQKLIDYLEEVVRAVERGTAHEVSSLDRNVLRFPVALRLPQFHIVPPGPPPGFDAWLQRGRLVAKYREAQGFMAVSIKLRKKLPLIDDARAFADERLTLPGARNLVRYRYGDAIEEEEEDTKVVQWKAKYCVWTYLGDWLSEECYEKKHGLMVPQSAKDREAQVEELRKNGQNVDWTNKKKQEFLDVLDGVWRRLEEMGQAPKEYLEDQRGKLSESHYSYTFNKKVSTDYLRAQDKNFCERYINGYEFSAVPKFRLDHEAWRKFVRSWWESIEIEAAKPRNTVSLATRTIQTAIGHADLDPEDLNEMDRFWSREYSSGSRVWAKFKDGVFYPGTVTNVVKAATGEVFNIAFDDGDRDQVSPQNVRSMGDLIAAYYKEDAELFS